LPVPGRHPVLDLAPGTDLRLARPARLPGTGQRPAAGAPRRHPARRPALQRDGRRDRHGPDHAAVLRAAALRGGARLRLGPHAGRGEPGRAAGIRLPTGVLPAVAARAGGGGRARLRPDPGLLRHPGDPRRRQGDHGGDEDRQQRARVLRLGRGQRAGDGPPALRPRGPPPGGPAAGVRAGAGARSAMSASPVPVPRRLWLFVLVGLVLLYLVAPIFVVIPASFSDSKYLEFPPRAYSTKWYASYLGSADWLAATRASLTAAVLTAPVATPTRIAPAYPINRQ